MLLSWDSSDKFIELMGIRLFLIPAVFGLLYLDHTKTNPILKLLRWSYPLIMSGYFYAETVHYNKLIFDNLDSLLTEVESIIFGMQPSVEFSAIIPMRAFSELMYFAYFSFYLLIFAFALYLFFARRAFFKEGIFKLSISMYLFYLIFCFIPSAGPQFYFAPPDSILPDAYLFGQVMHIIQNLAEQPTGAFPSSHVGISLIILLLSFKSAPKFFKLAWPFVFLLILSTVYIKAHYVVDVIGGLLIAPLILYVSIFLYQLPAWTKLHSSHQST